MSNSSNSYFVLTQDNGSPQLIPLLKFCRNNQDMNLGNCENSQSAAKKLEKQGFKAIKKRVGEQSPNEVVHICIYYNEKDYECLYLFQ